MIFVTVGSMIPFDRLIQWMDTWASSNPEQRVFAQIGEGSYVPTAMQWRTSLPQTEYRTLVGQSSIVVAHAGMGSVITAVQHRKPLVLVPRLKSRGEHNTDHQIATARWLKGKPGIFVAESPDEMNDCIASISETGIAENGMMEFGDHAPREFLERVRRCVLTR